MRNLEDIEKELAAAREALSSVKGTPAEVYSRIVGYYRSVRNWNKGKREEYGERRLFRVKNESLSAAAASPSLNAPVQAGFNWPGASERIFPREVIPVQPDQPQAKQSGAAEMRLMLFVRSSCPGCIPAKAAASKLGIPVDLVNTDTSEGMAEAMARNVLSTPTAILLSEEGLELNRARNAESIGKLPVKENIKAPELVYAAAI